MGKATFRPYQEGMLKLSYLHMVFTDVTTRRCLREQRLFPAVKVHVSGASVLSPVVILNTVVPKSLLEIAIHTPA